MGVSGQRYTSTALYPRGKEGPPVPETYIHSNVVCLTIEVTEYFTHHLSSLPVPIMAPATVTLHDLMHHVYI